MAFGGFPAQAETKAEPQKTEEPPQAKKSLIEGEALVDTLECKHGEDTRRLEVQTKGPGCTLQYFKFGKTNEIALSHHGVDLCQEKMKVVESNLEQGGYKCE
jgi:hypothetical protein